MRILVISPDSPLPADTGGRIRIWNIVRGLAKRHEVHLFVLCVQMPNEQVLHQLEEILASVHFISQPTTSSQAQGALAMLCLQPYHTGALASHALRAVLSQFTSRYRPDLVFINTIWLTPYLDIFPDIPAVVDQQNSDRHWWVSYLRSTNHPLKRLLVYFNLALVKRFENLAYPRYKLCFSVCDEDKDITQPLMLSIGRVVVAPNGVDTELFRPVVQIIEPCSLMYVGSMDVAANIAAVNYFICRVLPIIWQNNPAVKFIIVGRHPPQKIRALAQDPRIEVTGTVKEVQPYLAQAQVVVIPHIAPGGTKLKVLASMSMGKAIVATPDSVRGIDVVSGQDLIVADTPSEFADQVLRLLNDSALRKQLGRHARRLVELRYNWDTIVAQMENELAIALQK